MPKEELNKAIEDYNKAYREFENPKKDMKELQNQYFLFIKVFIEGEPTPKPKPIRDTDWAKLEEAYKRVKLAYSNLNIAAIHVCDLSDELRSNCQ